MSLIEKSKEPKAKRMPQKEYTVVIVQHPPNNDPAVEKEPEFAPGFEEKEVRRKFVWKVYSILSVQLICTILLGVAMLIHTPTREYFATHRWWALIAILLALIPLLIMCIFPQTARTVPTNYILLCIFTGFQGFAIGVISCAYETEIIVIAMGTTTVTVIVITLLAASDLFDITKCGLLLLVLTIVHMIMLIIGIIIVIAFDVNFRIVHLILSIAGAFLFSLWLAYDTQLILGGKSHQMSPEDYIFGAIALYMDITQIFLYMLGIFGGAR